MSNKKYIPEIDLQVFDYELPHEKIAEFPTENREKSKLLFADVNKQSIEHYQFSDIVDLLPDDTLLVLNSTKVIAARIAARKETGGKAEILCVDPLYPSTDPQILMSSTQTCTWKCIIGGRGIKAGSVLLPQNDTISFQAEIIEKTDNEAIVCFRWDEQDTTFADVLQQLGRIPLPPYIKRAPIKDDTKRYQTVYADTEGSVAAPTAGLHFTQDILKKISDKGCRVTELTLHVGPGTFKPIDGGDVAKHDMHSEQIFVTDDTLNTLVEYFAAGKKNIIATGTTSLRTLESLYWYGAKLFLDFESIRESKELVVNQWDPYLLSSRYSTLPTPEEAFKSILDRMEELSLDVIHGRTQLFIMPGYDFKVIQGIITNFHMPKSTLILLVASFMGYDLWRKVYNTALDNEYRFLSYGDSSFLLKK